MTTRLLVLRTLAVCVSVIVTGAEPQSNVDRVSQTLETLAAGTENDWKLGPAFQRVAPDGGALDWSTFTGDPRRRDFDDSNWKSIKLGEAADFAAIALIANQQREALLCLRKDSRWQEE